MKDDSSGKCFELALGYACNARCAFCSQAGFKRAPAGSFRTYARAIWRARRAGYTRLGFTGGEPLLHPDIVALTALARSAGFRYIRLQTNGIRLGDAALCRRLAAAGLTFCKFSIMSDRPAEHDRLSGVKGSHAKAMRGLALMRRLGVRVSCNVLVSKLNYRRLPAILAALLKKGVSEFIVIYPQYAGAMAGNKAGLGVSLPACRRYFSAASRLMEKAGLPGGLLFLNVPPCFTGGRDSLAIGLGAFNTVVSDPSGALTDLDHSADAAKVRAPACARCRLAGACAGVDRGYAQLFPLAAFRPAPPLRAPAAPGRRVYLSDNERCLLQVLRGGAAASTREVLSRAAKLIICRDCADSNSVINAAASLEKKGLVARAFSGGVYYWRLTCAAASGGGR